MAKTIAVFSGQGSQYVGMAQSLYNNFRVVKDIFDCGSDILGKDLASLAFSGEEAELSKTINSQPLIFAHSVSAFSVAKEIIPMVDAVAGHSLGEFAAVWAAGGYSLEDGFRIIGARAKAMENAAEKSKGIMMAILGVDYEAIEAACQNEAGFVFPVNLNLATQTVISGEEGAVNAVAERLTLEHRRVKAIKLGVNSAFHTAMMEPAAAELKEKIGNIPFHKMKIPFFSNITGDILEITNYPQYFAKHMVSPVKFTKQVQAMKNYGIIKAVEFGPKKTVATFIKKNCGDIAVANVDTSEDIQNLTSFLG